MYLKSISYKKSSETDGQYLETTIPDTNRSSTVMLLRVFWGVKITVVLVLLGEQ
jgi:hypothetical protein